MPFQSKSQMRKLFGMESRGELPEGTAQEWARETPDIKGLPERKKPGRFKRLVRKRKKVRSDE